MQRLFRFVLLPACQLWCLQLLVSCGNDGLHALTTPEPETVGDELSTTTTVETEEKLGDGAFRSEAYDFALPEDTEPFEGRPLSSVEHPYLLVGKESGDLRDEALDSSTERYRIFLAVKKVVDSRISSCPFTGLSAFGLCYWVTGKETYAKAVHAQLRALANEDVWTGGERGRKFSVRLQQFALGYDFCYPYLRKQSDFRKIRDKLALETSKMYEAITSDYNSEWRNFWRGNYAQNHFHRNAGALVFGALALKFEGDALSNFSQRDVNKWIETVKYEWIKNHEATKGNVDGSWYEGDGYDETTLGSDMPEALHLLKHVEGLDLITTSPLLRMVSVYWIYNSNPEFGRFRLMQSGDNGAAWARRNGLLSTLRLCAREFRDPYAQWAADKLVTDGKRDSRFSTGPLYSNSIVHEFFYFDESVPSRSPENAWPESWHAKDLEAAFMRTGWQKGQLHAALKCGRYGGANFSAVGRRNSTWRNGRWVNGEFPLDGSKGVFPQDFEFSTGHTHPDNNSFYIVGGGSYLALECAGKEKQQNTGFFRKTMAHNTVTIDGRGQIGDGFVHPGLGNDRDEFYDSQGTISTFAPTANYDLTVGDATTCYPKALTVKDFRRHFFFLKPDYFVVFDSLASESPREYTWNCHFSEEVSFDGRWIQGGADKGNVLGVNVVSPSSFSRDTGSVQSDHFAYLDGDQELNYVRLSAKGASERRFITVLYPTTTTAWAKRPQIQKISENRVAAGVRVTHANSAKDVILCNYNGEGLTQIDTFALDGVGGVVRRGKEGALLSLYLAKGKQVNEGNRTLVKLARRGGSFEASYSGDLVEVTGIDVPAFELYAPDARSVTINGAAADFSRDGNRITVEP